MATKISSPRFSVDSIGLKKVGKGMLIAAAGGVLVYLESIAGMPDFGGIGTIIQFAVSAGLVNLARKFLSEF